jgi:hypothetical protein
VNALGAGIADGCRAIAAEHDAGRGILPSSLRMPFAAGMAE